MKADMFWTKFLQLEPKLDARTQLETSGAEHSKWVWWGVGFTTPNLFAAGKARVIFQLQDATPRKIASSSLLLGRMLGHWWLWARPRTRSLFWPGFNHKNVLQIFRRWLVNSSAQGFGMNLEKPGLYPATDLIILQESGEASLRWWWWWWWWIPNLGIAK